MVRAESKTRKTARRNQVLDAASLCFVEKGFHGAGMAEIAKEAQMSTGHIYHYFKNKHAIIAAIVERDGKETLENISSLGDVPAVEFADSVISTLEERFHSEVTLFASRLNLEILAESRRDPQIEHLVREIDDQKIQLLESIISEKFNRPDVSDEVDLMITLFAGASSRPLQKAHDGEARLNPILVGLIRDLFSAAHKTKLAGAR
tara:strand:- start:11328 stop:11942 length:615 start_codon:yes stop_codon:yes gene_type:complete